MAKKTAPKGIGYINDQAEFRTLVRQVADIINSAFARSGDNAVAINTVKSEIDSFVGRGRQRFTKTDVYQVAYLMFHPIVKALQERNNVTFKDTQVNTLVAKLMTEGQYGNPSVVRRQTTTDKISELKRRLFESSTNIYSATSFFLTETSRTFLINVAERMLVRGTRSTTTTRVSNRTRRTTSPTTRTTTPAAPQVTQTTAARAATTSPTSSNLNAELAELRTMFGLFATAITQGTDPQAKKKLFISLIPYLKIKLKIKFNVPNSNNDLAAFELKTLFQNIYSDLYFNNLGAYNTALVNAIELMGYALTGNRVTAAKRIVPNLTGGGLSMGYFTRPYINDIVREFDYRRIQGTLFYKLFNPSNNTNQFITKIVRLAERGVIDRDVIRDLFGLGNVLVATMPYLPGYIQEGGTTAPQTSAISVPQLNRNATPSRAEVNATPEGAVTDLVKEAKFKNTLGIEIEYQEVSFGELKKALTAAKIDVWPRYLEYHQSCNYDKYKQWRIMHDGSVKDRFKNAYPRNIYNSSSSTESDIMFGECVSPILVGERGLLQLIRVLNVMTKLGATNNLSTGIHIHLGIRDRNQPYGITYKGLRNFMINYMGFEKIIDAYVREARRQNKHAYTPSPIADFFPDKRVVGGGLENLTYRDLEGLSNKFNAMNDAEFISYATRKLMRGKINAGSNNLKFSFEIRQHGGTIERDTLIGWILFMNFLCVFSEKKIATKFTWKNLSENILPKQLASFWENRITDMTGTKPDDFNGPSK